MRLGKEPLVQFAVGGALIFTLWTVMQRGKAMPSVASLAAAAASSPALSRTVALDKRTVDGLRAGFRAGMRREPNAAELSDLVQEAVDEEILFREGLARGLDRDDGVVRRRLIEKMTALIHPSAPTSDPPREQLRRWYETYRHRFVIPATVTFDQLFFDPQRHADAAAAAGAALVSLAAAASTDPPPAGTGDHFILSPRMNAKTEVELAHLYGDAFARAVIASPLGRWQGPFGSRYGLHLVRAVERRAERLPPFEEVEKLVRADWLTVETRGQRAAAETLLPTYEVVLPPDLRGQLASTPGLAPILKRVR
jgi:peptidyl-prolyl cis-trans isomerase C